MPVAKLIVILSRLFIFTIHVHRCPVNKKKSITTSDRSISFEPWHGISNNVVCANIFDFTAAGDWDCVGAVERLPALRYSVDFILLSFGIMGFIVEL